MRSRRVSVKITNWCGRLGNNLFQIANACAMAKKYSTNVEYPSHNTMRDICISFGKSEVNVEGEFFGLNSRTFPKINNTEDVEYVIDNRYVILKEIGRELLPHKDKQMNYDIVFHFRGGDIFNGRNSHEGYVQSPFSYYQYIMDKEKPKRVLLVCEDEKNPMIHEFMNRYGGEENVTIKLSVGDSLINDINKIMNCKVLSCSGKGTFIPALSACSNKIETLYYPLFNNIKEETLPSILSDERKRMKNVSSTTYFVFHHNYIKAGEWAGKIEDHDMSDLELFVYERM